MRWEPITPDNIVAKMRVASEHAISDFKLKYDVNSDPAKRFEIAKDICAFANHLGGTILVGAREGTGSRKGLIARLETLHDPSPSDLVKEVDRAVRLCAPLPSVNAIAIPLDQEQVAAILARDGEPAVTIVAINVEPGLSTPYGCRSCAEQCKECSATATACSCRGKEIPDAYRFPIRVIETTRFLRPDELARVMSVAERRAAIELQQLETEPEITVWFNAGNAIRSTSRKCKVIRLDTSLMLCVLELCLSQGRTSPDVAEIPLTFVRAVWRSAAGWNVAIDGIAFERDARGATHLGFFPPGGYSFA